MAKESPSELTRVSAIVLGPGHYPRGGSEFGKGAWWEVHHLWYQSIRSHRHRGRELILVGIQKFKFLSFCGD